MQIVAAFCFKCQKSFDIELSESYFASKFYTVACDHCGYQSSIRKFHNAANKRATAPIREQQRKEKQLKQETQRQKKATNAAIRTAKAEKRKAAKQAAKEAQAIQEEQEYQADADRLDRGVGCPRCGSLESKPTRRTTSAGWIFFITGVLCLVASLFIILFCILFPLGIFFILTACFLHESKLRCLKCGFVRTA